MSAQHTPGPWVVEPSWSERCGGDVSIVNREHTGDDWDVCIVHSSEANARLIAAAPDLLAELRNMVEWCGRRGETLGEDKLLPIKRQPPEVQAAMRAIAKAVDDQSVVARTCSAERPCINCYADQGECLGPAPETVRARQAQTDEARCVENLQP